VPSSLERVEICVGQRSSTRVSPGIAGPARFCAAGHRPARCSHLYHHLAWHVCLSLAFCLPRPSGSLLASALLTLAAPIVTAAPHLVAFAHAPGDSFVHAHARRPGSAAAFCLALAAVGPTGALAVYHAQPYEGDHDRAGARPRSFHAAAPGLRAAAQIGNAAHKALLPGPRRRACSRTAHSSGTGGMWSRALADASSFFGGGSTW
jgi:hypothetical protein